MKTEMQALALGAKCGFLAASGPVSLASLARRELRAVPPMPEKAVVRKWRRLRSNGDIGGLGTC